MASDFAIRLAAYHVRNGGVIAYPTDTVYGLGCDPLNTIAIHRLNTLKNRPPGKGLILLASHIELLDEYMVLPDKFARQQLVSSDSPTSWVVPARKHLPLDLTGGRDTIAVRITQTRIVTKLCQQLGHPLVSSSVNRSGKPPAKNSQQLHRWFAQQLDFILTDDHAGSGKPSMLKHIHTQHIYRN